MDWPEHQGQRHFILPNTYYSRSFAQGQVSPTHMIVCPVCRCRQNHLTAPTYQWKGRRDGFELPIEGECGHRWRICVHFHKGQLFTYAAVPGDEEAARNRERRYRGLPDWCLRLHMAVSDDDDGMADPREDF